MRDEDVAYYRRRINQEFERAGRCKDRIAARIHTTLAESYIGLLRSNANRSVLTWVSDF